MGSSNHGPWAYTRPVDKGARMGTGGGEDRRGHWIEADGRFREVVCIGDSTTLGVPDPSTGEPTESWVDLLAVGLRAAGAAGYRGMWRGAEWSRSGTWTKTTPDD